MIVWRILDVANIKPHRIRYYMEKRDLEFDRKMAEVLMVYQEVNLKNASLRAPEVEATPIITVASTRSREFIALLKRLDDHYPKEAVIRVVLDNHSAYISKETMAYLATRPNRFVYVHTPKHGSWLNLVETTFSKMARTFLRHIRVTSKEDLKERIRKGLDEWNANPVVFRWSNFDLGLT